MLIALRYKLRVFGVPIIGPASVLCDNAGVVKNSSQPASTLSKRHKLSIITWYKRVQPQASFESERRMD